MFNKKTTAIKTQPPADIFQVLNDKSLRAIFKRSCEKQAAMIKQAEELEKSERKLPKKKLSATTPKKSK